MFMSKLFINNNLNLNTNQRVLRSVERTQVLGLKCTTEGRVTIKTMRAQYKSKAYKNNISRLKFIKNQTVKK